MLTVLKFLREARRIRQQDFADRVGISQGALSLLETGRMRPAPEVAQRIALALGVALEDVFPTNNMQESTHVEEHHHSE